MDGGTFIYSFTHSNIGTSAQITEKLTDLSQGATSQPPAGDRGCFTELRDMRVHEVVVSESHVVILTESGRVCRIRYTEETTPPQNVTTPSAGREKSDDEAASTSSTRSYGSRSASPRPDEDRPSSSSLGHVWGSIMSSGPSSAVITGPSGSGIRVPGRGRILLRRRGGGHGIVARWPMIPAAGVPDELVDQAMAVLQGKSREMVIRELQRTNLDVNQAVNNLLSREDDDGEGSHDEASGGLIASGEELLSLLGPGLASVGEEELDEVLGRARGEEGGGASGRDSRLTLYEFSDPLLQNEIRSLVSIGDSAAGGGGGSGEGNKRGGGRSGLSTKKKNSPSLSQVPPLGPVLFDSSTEWWGDETEGPFFKHITGMYSELLAVGTNGKLHGWMWLSPIPSTRPHPLEANLEIADESVRLLSGKLLRGSVITESGKLGTFVDKCVRGFGSRLEHKAQLVAELSGETASSLSVSELVSALSTESGKIYWWGVLPFSERKQAVSQNQEKMRALKYQYSSHCELVEGSRVCLRSSPVYSVGTKAIHIKGTQIQCGILQEDVMSPTLSEKCQFKVVSVNAPEEMEAENNETKEEVHIGTKRRRSDDDASSLAPPTKTEVWSLRDVIFTDHVTNLKEGSVVKLDGSYAAVHYPPLDSTELSQVNLESCRLLRKDELVLVSEASPHQTPYFIQDTPRKLRPPSSHTLLTMATDQRGLHCLFAVRELIHYVVFNLDSGKLLQDSMFGQLSSQYLLKQGGALQLMPINLSVGVVMDQHGGLFPVSKNNTGNIRDLPQLNIPPVSCVGVGVCSNRNSLVSVVYHRQQFMPAVLRKDVPAISQMLTRFKAVEECTAALREHCSGGCNVFHVLASLARPPDPTPIQGEGKKGSGAARSTPRGLLRDIMKQAVAMASNRSPPIANMDWSSEGGEGDEETQSDIVLDIFEQLMSLEGQEQVFTELMQERSLDGYTPFMAAVTLKAYGLASLLLNFAQQLSGEDKQLLTSMLYPPDCHHDDNPVFVLVRNDTCSFTWTGEEHIQQDIFECRTCGLVGSLCCCTECAYTCHRGHNCSFKKASPTAYCDCWEVGKCHALASGYEFERRSLLDKLLKCSDLGSKVNARGEHLIGLLAGTVARQGKEQSHWSGGRMGGSFRHSRAKHDDIPSYNLPPPRFAQKALNMAIENWECVKAVLLCGCEGGEGVEGDSHIDTTSLDAFTHLLLTRLSQKTLDTLLTLLVAHLSPSPSDRSASLAACRFLRSVTRVFTVAQLENTTLTSNITMETSRKKSHASSPLVERAQKVLVSLAPLAVKQLVPMAKSIILPVMLGVARPMDPLCMSERGRVCEDVFRLPLVPLLRVGACESERTEGDTESDMGDDDPPTLALDASSTVTTGSHLLYLSDQDSSDDEEVQSVPDDVSIGESHDDYSLLEPTPSHRVPQGGHWALPRSRPTFHNTSRLSRSSNIGRDLLSMGMSTSLLAQTFSLLIRQLAETMDSLWDRAHCHTPSDMLSVSDPEPRELYTFVWEELEEVWAWLFQCMDMLQSQLEFGSVVSKKVSKAPPPSKHEVTSEGRERRKEVFSYILTLYKGRFGEHGGCLPTLDVAGMEHVAWVFDSLYYLLQNTRSPVPSSGGGEGVTHESLRFFHRSNSTMCLGKVPHSPFDPLIDVLPLAEKPQLMDSIQDKQVLFGYQSPVPLRQWPSCSLATPPILTLLSNRGGVSKGVWPHISDSGSGPSGSQLSDDQVCGWDSHKLSASILIGRWNLCLEVFGRAFMDTVGKVKGSVLCEGQQFTQRDKRFRREMDQLRSSNHKEMIIEVDRARDKFLSGLFQRLNHYCDHQAITGSQGSTPLLLHRLKVTFVGEQGEGSGVLRSMFTVTAEAVLSDDPPPVIEMMSKSSGGLASGSGGGGASGRRSRDKSRFSTSSLSALKRPKRSPSTLDPPLFYQPGKIGFYAPRVSVNTPERLNAYRNIGRLIGLCLLHTEVMTLPLCRHVFKFLLRREISWHDLAFFDPAMYESLRKMILDSRKSDGAAYLSTLGLTFSVTLRPEEGGMSHDLIEGGGANSVTPDNVYEYVRQYALLRMVTVNLDSLEQLREGLFEVFPESSLSQLSAEDLHLLLCGCPHIDVDVVRGITIFDDESRKDPEQLSRFKGWFWSVVERMTQRERQDLLYFWTSSPVLPASVDSYQPSPSVTIRPPDDQHLPTANTCISRLYVPLYSSKAILRARLLTAIKTKAFGFV